MAAAAAIIAIAALAGMLLMDGVRPGIERAIIAKLEEMIPDRRKRGYAAIGLGLLIGAVTLVAFVFEVWLWLQTNQP